MYVLSFGQWQVLIKNSMLKAQYVECVIIELYFNLQYRV